MMQCLQPGEMVNMFLSEMEKFVVLIGELPEPWMMYAFVLGLLSHHLEWIA